MARPGGRGGGRAGLDGRPRLPWLRQSGRDGARAGAQLGLELYRAIQWFEADRRGWRPVIARLEERGWCLPAKAEGLRRWPGIERLIGGGKIHCVRQGINHVKVVVERGARTEAKAYAGMEVRPYG